MLTYKQGIFLSFLASYFEPKKPTLFLKTKTFVQTFDHQNKISFIFESLSLVENI